VYGEAPEIAARACWRNNGRHTGLPRSTPTSAVQPLATPLTASGPYPGPKDHDRQPLQRQLPPFPARGRILVGGSGLSLRGRWLFLVGAAGAICRVRSFIP